MANEQQTFDFDFDEVFEFWSFDGFFLGGLLFSRTIETRGRRWRRFIYELCSLSRRRTTYLTFVIHKANMFFPGFNWGVDVSRLWKEHHKINTLAL
jgi:hypothetical protein